MKETNDGPYGLKSIQTDDGKVLFYRNRNGVFDKTGKKMRDIIVEFSGWVRLSPANAKFVKIGEPTILHQMGIDPNKDERPDMITGVEWQNLDDDDQGDYILEDVIAAQRDCDDGDYQQIDWFVDDSP